MCLNVITETRNVSRKNSIKGYKCGYLINNNFVPYFQDTNLSLNKWIKDKNTRLLRTNRYKNLRTVYPAGFHFYTNLKDITEWFKSELYLGFCVIVKVKGAGVVTIGEEFLINTKAKTCCCSEIKIGEIICSQKIDRRVAEWLKAVVLNTIEADYFRGFKSLPFCIKEVRDEN